MFGLECHTFSFSREVVIDCEFWDDLNFKSKFSEDSSSLMIEYKLFLQWEKLSFHIAPKVNMRDITLTMICWRFYRKILTAVLVCCTIYFIISVLTTKRGVGDVQGSNIHEERGGVRAAGDGGNRHHKNPQRKIQRLPHNPLPGEDVRQGAGQDDFSSSSTSSVEEDEQEVEVRNFRMSWAMFHKGF